MRSLGSMLRPWTDVSLGAPHTAQPAGSRSAEEPPAPDGRVASERRLSAPITSWLQPRIADVRLSALEHRPWLGWVLSRADAAGVLPISPAAPDSRRVCAGRRAFPQWAAPPRQKVLERLSRGPQRRRDLQQALLRLADRTNLSPSPHAPISALLGCCHI